MGIFFRAWKKTIVLSALFIAILAPRLAAETARETLAALDKALDSRLAGWELSVADGRWEPYNPGRSVAAANFRLRASFQAPAVFAAVKVAGTPLALKARMSGRGRSRRPSSWTAASCSRRRCTARDGTAVEMSRDVALWPTADDQDARAGDRRWRTTDSSRSAPPTGPSAGAGRPPTRGAGSR